MATQEKMNPRVKQMWIDALRSGNYKQGTAALKSAKNEYCCLGVLCDLHRKSTKSSKNKWVKIDKDSSAFNYVAGKEEDACLLPKAVQKWSGVLEDGRYVKRNNQLNTLIILNDEREYSFKKIADVIEKYF
jgi:hypothetical protein